MHYRNDPQKLAEKLEQLTTGSKTVPSKIPSIDGGSGFSTASPCSKKSEVQNQPVEQDSKGRFMQSKTKLLSALMKTELLADKSFEQIKQVSCWCIHIEIINSTILFPHPCFLLLDLASIL